MRDTKEVKEFYEATLISKLQNAVNRLNDEGFTEDTIAMLANLNGDLSRYDAIDHAYKAWHPDNKGE